MTSLDAEDSPARRLGRVLRKARRDIGLTQRELGKLLGVAEQQVGDWERGKHAPRPESLQKLALVLNYNVSEFLSLLSGTQAEHKTSAAPLAAEIHAPSYWQGELTASLRSLRAIQDLAGAVAATIQGTLASGVLAGSVVPAEPTETPAERKARLQREELEVEEQAVQARRARLAREAEEAKHAAEQAAQPPARRASGRR